MTNPKHLIGFLGGPCVGKTTLTNHLLEALEHRGVRAAWAREFATDDIRRNGPPDPNLIPMEQLRYYLGFVDVETRAMMEGDVVIADCPTLTCYVYALHSMNLLTEPRHHLFIEDLKSLFLRDRERYDHLYLLKREGKYEFNGIRFQSEKAAWEVDRIIHSLVEEFDLPVIHLEGTPKQRTQKVLKDLEKAGVIPCAKTAEKSEKKRVSHRQVTAAAALSY